MRDASKSGWLDLVRDQVASLRFGAVLITVHDGRVVQVERSEKVRLDQTPSGPPQVEPRVEGLSSPTWPLYEPTPKLKRPQS